MNSIEIIFWIVTIIVIIGFNKSLHRDIFKHYE